jgi:hypothetical protein
LLDLHDPRFFMAAGADGLFGPQTANAVRAFQQSNGLAVDGMVGAQTMGALDRLYSSDVVGQTKGIGLHLGLNGVDPAHYQGWDGALGGCEPDAKDMKVIADSKGFRSTLILTRDAKSSRLFSELKTASTQLTSGDILLLTYSGHGGQVPNTNGDDESDSLDETWCLFDREVIDDELYAAFTSFASGVRILVFSDSCHSGTVAKLKPFSVIAPEQKARAMPFDQADKVYKANQALYDSLQMVLPPFSRADVKASVLLISGCMDNQLSGDLGTNGVFTVGLKRVWNNGKFSGDYRAFHKGIKDIMPINQTPNLFTYGGDCNAFLSQRPFAV